MKKTILFLMLLVCNLGFFGCSSDDDDKSANPNAELLIGQWQMTHVYLEGQYVDVSQPPFSSVIPVTKVSFKADGTYSLSGYLGDGTGTYKVADKTITCKSNGADSGTYTIEAMTKSNCELSTKWEGNAVKIKFKKL